MKHLIAIGLTSVLALGSATSGIAAVPGMVGIIADGDATEFARQGRGRGGDDSSGHGSGHSSSHDSTDDNSDDDVSGSGRSRLRVPGGSGCDDAGDIAEHSGCGGA